MHVRSNIYHDTNKLVKEILEFLSAQLNIWRQISWDYVVYGAKWHVNNVCDFFGQKVNEQLLFIVTSYLFLRCLCGLDGIFEDLICFFAVTLWFIL